MRVLVIGTSGMLDNTVLRLFAQSPGHQVFGAVRSSAALAGGSAHPSRHYYLADRKSGAAHPVGKGCSAACPRQGECACAVLPRRRHRVKKCSFWLQNSDYVSKHDPFDPVALARIPLGLQKVRNFILKRVMLRSMADAGLTIFISDHARRTIEALTRVGNPVTIPHGINEAFRTHAQTLQRPAWLPTGEYLLYVSRFDVYKHQFEVASAFAALPSDLASRYKLLLVGETDEVLVRNVTELARNKGLEEQILVVGPVAYADLPAAYHHATVNLFASSCENCPNILLEALGAGRPVLSSDVMPMPEFGVDAVGYFSPTDPKSICDALLRVLRDESHRNELAAAAIRRSADFDWANTSQKTWQHITGLVTQ